MSTEALSYRRFSEGTFHQGHRDHPSKGANLTKGTASWNGLLHKRDHLMHSCKGPQDVRDHFLQDEKLPIRGQTSIRGLYPGELPITFLHITLYKKKPPMEMEAYRHDL